ncbi:AAA family ATPase [Mesorhizobium sangaii]|uniref:Putative ATPase n=1 Tax=Mesorhizobium sangaii TaxID=505389 RepID=A0A841PQG2_9HYPH|nr:AAA family ATPase [Mesorhizobium sangaii]MBB6412379.1 putative ATPase [Mesorhizobium sangaii]
MRIIKARIKGFQSFHDSGDLEFADSMNIVIGQNNAGKSALLRALLPALPDDRHRTPEKWERFRLSQPQVNFTIAANGSEIQDWILQSGSPQNFPVKILKGGRPFPDFRDIFGAKDVFLSVWRHPGENNFFSNYPSHNLFEHKIGDQQACITVIPRNGELNLDSSPTSSASDTLPSLLFQAWQRDMFYFAPERMTIGEAGAGYGARLQPDAGNLPNVLHTLSSERGDVFRQLVDHLREVFPTVGNLSVRTKPDNHQFEVRVWPTEAMERVELSFPLNSSGTGVSQVIALLAAIMTIDKAVIIIDEINSFLHPAAVKALLRILQTRYAHHQYIISTHAPEVIGFSNPSTIHLVKREGYESSVERLNLDEVGKFREVAEHLGVSMADVFAAERVVWVEGPTEELCFPYLYQQLVGPLPRGTIITSVAATGDFNSNRRDPAIVYEVYRRLSSAAATLVVSVVFSFDTEKLTDEEKAKMTRDSSGLLRFLPRRHLECYLIDPAAIAAFIISKDSTTVERVTPEAVEAALKWKAGERPLLVPEWKNDIRDTGWLARVDAANLVTSVCGALSEHRAPFAKKNDSLFLLKHILENAPERLAPLREYVHSLVSAAAAV